jgi:hypothetical protein
MPAYFWIHNLYALERNSWTTRDRDCRKIKVQHIESDYLAPDTAEEIITALSLLEGWLGEAGFSPGDMTGVNEAHDMRIIPCRHIERSKRHQVIIKPLVAIAAYRQMLHWYAAKTTAAFLDGRPDLDYSGLCALLGTSPGSSATPPQRVSDWVNIGGQITPAFRVDALRQEIGEGKRRSWDEIHQVYDRWHEAYPLDRARHAWAVLALLEGGASGGAVNSAGFLKHELAASVETRRWISEQIFHTRAKDYHNSFRKATFRNAAEMEQVLGKADQSPFICLAHEESRRYEELITRVMARL